jgi:hypothetical protein
MQAELIRLVAREKLRQACGAWQKLESPGRLREPTTKKKVFQGEVHNCETQRFRKQYDKINGHY